MRIHEIPGEAGAKKNRKRVGRGNGSGLGTTAGRGNKGALSRAGATRRSNREGGQMPLIRRIPKRGFKNIFRKEFTAVNVQTLEDRFEAESEIDPAALCEKGIIHKSEKAVKILGQGELTKTFHVKAHAFSKSAMEKIKAKGGKCEVLPC